jgi:hypothetical protein
VPSGVSVGKTAGGVSDIDALALHRPLEDASGEATGETDCRPTSANGSDGDKEKTIICVFKGRNSLRQAR